MQLFLENGKRGISCGGCRDGDDVPSARESLRMSLQGLGPRRRLHQVRLDDGEIEVQGTSAVDICSIGAGTIVGVGVGHPGALVKIRLGSPDSCASALAGLRD